MGDKDGRSLSFIVYNIDVLVFNEKTSRKTHRISGIDCPSDKIQSTKRCVLVVGF